MRTLLYKITPRTRAQSFLSYAAWLTLFEGVFLGWLWLFGLLQHDGLLRLLIAGALTCFPFLMIAMKMLKLHLEQHYRVANSSRIDMLTRIPSRRTFINEAEKELPAAGSIMMVADIDHFKMVNDTYGHAFGDKCLTTVAQNLRPVLSQSFHVGRLGGEEFGLFMLEGDVERAREIGAIISNGVFIRSPDNKDRLHITVSVGATVAGPNDTVTCLLNRADNALYRAKKEGRARLVFDFDPAQDDDSLFLPLSA